jgi:hypothetical protein
MVRGIACLSGKRRRRSGDLNRDLGSRAVAMALGGSRGCDAKRFVRMNGGSGNPRFGWGHI